ncbi:hypothetical protein BKA61DRAFT_196024 [Leptodontidium sp. MPI-SDFR-AT-0119]|nr:hypothetical protein BKA61DRAFT_196024 [Leptodontidium sp. MPI-SDFR-AT-0119]
MLSSHSSTVLSVAPERVLSIQIMPQCGWRQPELSVGSPCSSLDLLGIYKCWMVKDKSPAHAVWKDVSKRIINLLEDQFEHLDAGDSDLTFEMFMVGRRSTSSVPTILFSCESKSCRQKAMALVQKKSILAAYPGVLMAERSRMPKLLAQGEDSELLFLPSGVYLNGPLRTCGTSVLISFGPKRPTRIATIGGIVCIEEELYGVTAGHAFSEVKGTTNSDDNDAEFSFFGDSDPFDSSDEEHELVEMTSQASMSSGSSQSPDTNEFKFDGLRRKSLSSSLSSRSTEKVSLTRQSTIPMEDAQKRYGSLFASSDPDGSYDWALIKIEHPTFLDFPRTDEYTANNLKLNSKIVFPNSIAMGSVDTDVLTCTGSGGVVQGKISGVAAFKRAAGQKEFQQLLTMRLNMGSFHDGDCGSWVCDTRTGAVYGHIVSGYPGTGSAYLIPSEEIFQDMQRTLGKSVQLLTRTLAARNAALAIWGHIDFAPLYSKPAEDRENKLMPDGKDFIPRPVYVAQTEVDEELFPDPSKNTVARPGIFDGVNAERVVSPEMEKPSSHQQTPLPTTPVKPSPRIVHRRLSSSYNPTIDLGSSSSKRTTASIPPSDQTKNTSRLPINDLIESSWVATPRASSVKDERMPGVSSSATFGPEALDSVQERRERQLWLRDRLAELNPGKAQVSANKATLKETKPDKQPKIPSDSKGKDQDVFAYLKRRNNQMVKRPSLSGLANKPFAVPATPVGRDSPAIRPQPIPSRPRAMSSVGSPPISYYPSTMDSGYGSAGPVTVASAYGQQPQPFPVRPSYLPSIGSQYYEHPRAQPRPLAARFATPQQDLNKERFQEFLDDEDGYASAAEGSVKKKHIAGPPRPNSVLGVRDYEMSPALRRTTVRPATADRQTMSPPTRPLAGRPQAQYDIHPRRPDDIRRSVSYDIDRYNGNVRIEPAKSNAERFRNPVGFDGEGSGDSKSYIEKLRQATSYQENIARASTAPLTAESLRRSQRRRAPSSRDTRSTRSSRRTRSRSATSGSSSSSSSASSLTSKDESSSKHPVSFKVRKASDENEDVTIKVTGRARLMVGGAQIDCNDGGEIVINRMRSIVDNTGRPEDRTNYDFLDSGDLRRRFERSASTPGDEKSNLSKVSGTSDETVVRGKRSRAEGQPESSKYPFGD